jgi:hypothetical protein
VVPVSPQTRGLPEVSYEPSHDDHFRVEKQAGRKSERIEEVDRG